MNQSSHNEKDILKSEPFLHVEHVTKSYPQSQGKVLALEDISFSFSSGMSLAILGGSGAGKSTLLNLLGGLDTPDEGVVRIGGINLSTLGDVECAQFRNQTLGFVFQFHNLLKDFTVLENVCLPLRIRGESHNEILPQAYDLLKKVGLEGKENRLPQELSGGEQQRVALVRGVIHKPQMILADEPTGNLDNKNANRVFDLLCQLNHDLKATLVVVTHNLDLAKQLQNQIVLEAGRRVTKISS